MKQNTRNQVLKFTKRKQKGSENSKSYIIIPLGMIKYLKLETVLIILRSLTISKQEKSNFAYSLFYISNIFSIEIKFQIIVVKIQFMINSDGLK